MTARPSPVPSKNALRALRHLALSTPTIVCTAVGGIYGVATLNYDARRKVKLAESILETKRVIRSVSNGRGSAHMRQMFEAAEQGQDFTLDPKKAIKRRKVRNYSAVAVERPIGDEDDYVVIQRALQDIQRRPQGQRQAQRNDKDLNDSPVKHLRSRHRQTFDHGHEQRLPLEMTRNSHSIVQTIGPTTNQQAGSQDVELLTDHKPWGLGRRARGNGVEAIRAATTMSMKPPSHGVYARPKPYVIEQELDDELAPVVEYTPAPAQPAVRLKFEQTSTQTFDDGPDVLIGHMFDQALTNSLVPPESKPSYVPGGKSEGRDVLDGLADANTAVDVGFTQESALAAASLAADSSPHVDALHTRARQTETMEATSTPAHGITSSNLGVELTTATDDPRDTEGVRSLDVLELDTTSNRGLDTPADMGIEIKEGYAEDLRAQDDFVDWPTQVHFTPQSPAEPSTATSIDHLEVPPVESQESAVHYFGLCHMRVQAQLDAPRAEVRTPSHLSDTLPKSLQEQLMASDQRLDAPTPYCDHHPNTADQLAEAERCVRAVAHSGIKVDECLYEPAVYSLCSTGRAREAETFVTQMVHRYNVKPDYQVRYHLVAGLASTGDWQAVNEYMVKWHSSSQARKRPFAFARMFTAIFEHYLVQRSMNESYDYLMYALEHWGLIPTKEITVVFLPMCVRNGRFDLIGAWVQMVRELYPKMDADTTSLAVACGLADVWYQRLSSCEEIEKTCNAMSRAAVHDPFSAPLREIAMTAMKENLQRLLEKAKVLVTSHDMRMIDMDLDNFDSTVRSATALLQNYGHQHMSSKLQRLFINIGRQIDAVTRLSNIFSGAPSETRSGEKAEWLGKAVDSPQRSLGSSDAGFGDHQIRHRTELWPMVARDYVRQQVEGKPISHKLLESTVTQLRLQKRHGEAIQLLESVHKSPYVQGTTGTFFEADMYHVWLRTAMEAGSLEAMETALFASLSSMPQLENDTRFKWLMRLVIGEMKQRVKGASMSQTSDTCLTADYHRGRLEELLRKREGTKTSDKSESFPRHKPWWEWYYSPAEPHGEYSTNHTTSRMVAVA